VREADEWTKVAGFGVLQPLIEVAHTPPRDQSTETLQQRASKGEPLVAFENVLECSDLVLFQLVRWT
jgi:hypothetical protein